MLGWLRSVAYANASCDDNPSSFSRETLWSRTAIFTLATILILPFTTKLMAEKLYVPSYYLKVVVKKKGDLSRKRK
jgi:hypothetical protein